MKRYALALDLVDRPDMIAQYIAYHQEVWPEIKASILDVGIVNMEIYNYGNRLFMLMEVSGDFSFKRKASMDKSNPKVQEWEELMWKYQKALPGAAKGEKWVLMDKIFQL